MAEFPTYEQMAKNVAEKALDEFLYNGKSIREWMQIIASEDAISRQEVLDYIHRILNQGTGKKKSFEFIQKYVTNMPSIPIRYGTND